MPEFDELKSRLSQLREERRGAEEDLRRATSRREHLAREQDAFQRASDPSAYDYGNRSEQIQGRRAQAEAEARNARAELNNLASEEHRLSAELARLADPRTGAGRMNDGFPLLLMPVRLEARFREVTTGGGRTNQLWVRIYPDACTIDTFEATLSEVEKRNVERFWAETWAAGKIERQERAAWRTLVAAHGSGRAAWLVKTYRPVVEPGPTKLNAQDVVLVIPTRAPLDTGAAGKVTAYWSAVWLADGEAGAVASARAKLDQDFGADVAARLVREYEPFNLSAEPEPPWRKSEVALKVEYLILPPADDAGSKTVSWTQAAKTYILPERFVVIGYVKGASRLEKAFEVVGNPVPPTLAVGPDPSAPEGSGLRQENGEVFTGDELRWMIDFDEAVARGVGFRINITRQQAREGFDRLVVLGLRLGSDQTEARGELERLISNQLHSRGGFSLLPQGTATNNTEAAAAGYSRTEDPNASFDVLFRDRDAFRHTADWFSRRDGQWLADALGLGYELLGQVPHAGGTDLAEARAMNVALWPATLGYTMDSMMQGVFEDDDIENARWYFTHFVSGRGMLPAVRIGRQPYGVLPTTVFSRMAWGGAGDPLSAPPTAFGRQAFLPRLHKLLLLAGAEWGMLAGGVARVGKPGDPHQTLLDIVGLHPTSVEYHQRYAESLAELLNRFSLEGLGGLIGVLLAAAFHQAGMDLLKKLGYAGQETPDILQKFFFDRQNLLKGPLVDDRPLSETEPVRAYTADNRNYIKWLADAARSSLETVRLQQGFLNDTAPTALLYLMLRHALLLGYWDTSLGLYVNARAIDARQARRARVEQPFVHVRDGATSESRWARLYTTEPSITGSASVLLADYITSRLGELEPAGHLNRQLQALELLKDAPTARLERAFAEHVDCCSYRFDAWLLGLAHERLAEMRYRSGGTERVSGIYLGAYAWLEELRPTRRNLRPARLDSSLTGVFGNDPRSPLMQDETNGGYVHAPSLNQAVTAAVLRSGYLSNATPANPQTLAVNLSSGRVRAALAVLEGIRGGQSLAALLGYQFERGLHDRHNLAEVDQFVFKLRQAFPLSSNRLNTTSVAADVPIEAVEARNVLDGLRLVEHVQRTGRHTYPFGLTLPAATSAQAAAINAEVEKLLDIHDALADVALAEGVHQAVQGNYDRATASLETYLKSSFPPLPDVVQTPRSGVTLTHRVALHLRAGLDPTASPLTQLNMTPRATADAALNAWLAGALPAPEDVACVVSFYHVTAGHVVERPVTQRNLGLQPLDLLFVVRASGGQAMTELDDRILRYVSDNFPARPDRGITIHYTKKVNGGVSFFQLAPLVAHLRALLLRSRPLRPSDLILPDEAEAADDSTVFADPARVELVKTELQTLLGDVTAFAGVLAAPLANAAANRAQLLANADAWLSRMAGLLSRASLCGAPQTGWGFLYEWRQQAFADLLGKVEEFVADWQNRLEEFDRRVAEYDTALGLTDPERFDQLRRAERLIVAQPAVPPPPLDDFRLSLNPQRAAFDAKLRELRGLTATTRTTVSQFLGDVASALPITAFDLKPFKLEETEDRIVSFEAELLGRARTLEAELRGRVAAGAAQLASHNTATTAADRVEALRRAAKALLGDELPFVSEFTLAAARAQEVENAAADGALTELLRYLKETKKIRFPVDHWLYGVARVREKLRHWEQALLLLEGFKGAPGPELRPLQFPFRPADRWLALDIPGDRALDREQLLYTAHFAATFDKTARQCGLLLDEWAEVIPGKEETTGVVFHFDRPSSEPPQAMLLVVPPVVRGAWRWDDIVDALGETLDLAKKRGVEPAQLDGTTYARFLPATITATALHQISILMNYAANNNLSAHL